MESLSLRVQEILSVVAERVRVSSKQRDESCVKLGGRLGSVATREQDREHRNWERVKRFVQR